MNVNKLRKELSKTELVLDRIRGALRSRLKEAKRRKEVNSWISVQCLNIPELIT